MKATDLRNRLEEVMDLFKGDYSSAQWNIKKEIDMARYNEAKKLYNEAENSIEDLDWNGSSDEDYEAISQLMERLNRKIDSIDI